MACVVGCSQNAIQVRDTIDAYNAVINEDHCIHCGRCYKVCPNNNPIVKQKPIKWYEGWADSEIRSNSSSGGAASAIMLSFIEQGGYVASCHFDKGQFCFDITKTPKEIYKFSGSKYVKSNPEKVYRKILELLNEDKKVLFLGLPCQTAGLKNYLKNRDENLYTVDLICHGSPSPQILTMFLKENNIDIEEIKDIKFRKKIMFDIYVQKEKDDFVKMSPPTVQDIYSYAFLNSLVYTQNCYSCPYATLERISDVTLGDSWGSILPENEKGKGISLILCQTERGLGLVKNSGLILHTVDLKKAVQTNGQLCHPSVMPVQRSIFFKYINKGFIKAIAKSVPKIYYKKRIKSMVLEGQEKLKKLLSQHINNF